jgi:predicted  nucleic acid-binding Zn-ribbon protein
VSDPKRSGTEYRDDGQGWREISAAEVPASAALRSEVESYRSTVAALDAEIRRLKSEVERRRSDIKGEIMRHDDEEQIRDLRKERDSLRARLSDYERWHVEALAALFPEGVPAMRHDLPREIASLRARLADAEADLFAARQAVITEGLARDRLAEALRAWLDADDDVGPLDDPHSAESVHLRAAKVAARAALAGEGEP